MLSVPISVASSTHELPRLPSTCWWLPSRCTRWRSLGRCWLPSSQHAPYRAGQRGQLCRAVQPGLPLRHGSQHVWDIWRSQRAKSVSWGSWGWLSSSAPWWLWAATSCPAACPSLWNVSTPRRKPTSWDALISSIPRGPCARPAYATPWTAAPRGLSWTASNDLSWAVTNATPWAAASAKLPRILRIQYHHPCCSSSPVWKPRHHH